MDKKTPQIKKERVTTPPWFMSMNTFLSIVEQVVEAKDSMFTGRNIHELGHPEDLMVIVMDITETVATTITVLGDRLKDAS